MDRFAAQNFRSLVALAAAAMAVSFLTACGPGDEARHRATDSGAEQALLTSLSGSTSMRYTHVRCMKASAGDWTDVCTFQGVAFREGADQPLVVTGYRIEDGQLRSGSGTVPLDVACAEEVRCWTSTLCAATWDCPSGLDGYFGEPVTPPARA